ncbi:HAE1 family hydrophobic/amphiphilic exporter-1 [Catenuloplanes nepalensis]|uniref:HAE1 family hydrophobic/amphiphilic exporter-1 n=1 Tax=Catenuloplanes nepalensis TaxID=587533 RepID=A0ABT9N1R1_9ACTN|nr:efflux RND transporter permease subunit [Catenuloplanes nepalensis]MDP9797433.1 HAE1 family hydrophobic/amphiphilic exporter-1 [Catenuloplanes nepalensis]
MSLLARLSLANRGLIALIAIIVTGFGAFAIPSLKQQLLPSLEFPAAFIFASYPGASPEIVEQRVTEPIENSVQGIEGLDEVTSTTSEGVATVQVLFEFGTDLTQTVSKIESNLGRIRAQLPEDVDPTVFAGSTADLPAIVLAASGGTDEAALAAALNESVLPELQGIEGVRTAEVTGARTSSITITPDLAKFGAAGVNPAGIATALQANGVSVPAGTLTEGERTLTVQVGTPITTLEDLQNIYLSGTGGRAVRLGDVATVAEVPAAPTSYTRTDGVDSLGLSVTATPDGNAVRISEEIRDRLPELAAASGATLTVVFDQAPFVEKSIESLATEGLLGLVMAVIVILVFLLSIRSTIVTAVSIPLSVLVALIALWLQDYSLNLLTLGALTIAVGRVVDDSIVVLENIKRHLGYGEEKLHAITTGVQEVAGAVLASTLTTVAVFAPIALVGGFVGQLFAPFAVTVTVALIASLIVSLTIVPVLAYWFLRRPKGTAEEAEVARKAAEEKELRSPLQRSYLPVIRFATTWRWTTIGIGVVVLLITGGLATQLKTNFIDQSGQDTLSISQTMPIGTSLEATNAQAKRVEAVLSGAGEVKSYQATVGGGGQSALFTGGGSGANSASYSVTLEDDVDTEAFTERLRGDFEDLGPSAGEITVGADSSSGFSGNELAVVVKAADAEALAAATKQVQDAMAGTPDVTDVTSDLAESVPRIDITVDRAAATARGLSEAQIGQLVAGAFRDTPIGQVTLTGSGERNVVLDLGGTAPADLTALRAYPLQTPGGIVPLDDVADVNEVQGPVEITRINGDRSVTVTGTVSGSNIGAATTALTTELDEMTPPAGASWEIGGVSADQNEAFSQLGLAVLAAIAIVFIIMVATFGSIIQPLILLVSIPFAATGAILLLLVTDTALGVPALIGVLMLVGIVVTNAIVLMDLINQYRKQGYGVQQAVIEGGRHRLRPILMTAIATIFALTPMALGLTGEGGFISQPLAVVVIGGLISSTLLTLLLVPALYTLVEGRRERRAERKARKAEKAQAGVPAPAPATPTTAPSAPSAPSSSAAPEKVDSVPETQPPSGALRDGTDQFEVLRLPRSNRSPLPPQE